MTTRLISISDTRQLIIEILSEAFPGVAFTVSAYKNSLDVLWVDGPTNEQVQRLVECFETHTHIEYQEYQRYHWLDRHAVKFDVRYVFAGRQNSETTIKSTLREVAQNLGKRPLTIKQYKAACRVLSSGRRPFSASQLQAQNTNNLLANRGATIQSSPTHKRIQFQSTIDAGNC